MFEISHNLKKNNALSICSIYFVKSQGFALALAKASRSVSCHLCCYSIHLFIPGLKRKHTHARKQSSSKSVHTWYSLNKMSITSHQSEWLSLKIYETGTSLTVQWPRLCASSARGQGFNPWSGNSIPRATRQTQHSQISKYFKNKLKKIFLR